MGGIYTSELHNARGRKPTVAGGVDAFEQAAFGLEAADAVPLAVEHLQPGEDRGVELRQPVVPHVQLGHVSQQVRFIGDHPGDLIEPDRERGGGQRCSSGGSAAVARPGTSLRWWLTYCTTS